MTIYVGDRLGQIFVVPAIEHLAIRRTGRVAASHTLISRSALGTRVSTPSKSNSAATKSCSGYPLDLVPDLRGCLSFVSVSVLILAIDECVILNDFMAWPEGDEDLERGYLLMAVMAV